MLQFLVNHKMLQIKTNSSYSMPTLQYMCYLCSHLGKLRLGAVVGMASPVENLETRCHPDHPPHMLLNILGKF